MKRLSLKKLLAVLLVLLFSGCIYYYYDEKQPERGMQKNLEASTRPIRMVLHKKNDRTEASLEFYDGNRQILSFVPTYRLGFMQCFDGFYDDGKARRMGFESIDSDTDYRDFLIDMKGDGDRRHLVIVEWSGGNSAFGFKGYLIDTKDDFAVIGEIPAGECYDYTYKNPELIFTFSEEICYFGASGSAYLQVPLKIEKGKFPVCMFRPVEKFDLEPYKEIMNRESYNGDNSDRVMALYCLYCDLASAGRFSDAEKYAAELGFTPEEIKKYGQECSQRIMKSSLYKYLLLANKPR